MTAGTPAQYEILPATLSGTECLLLVLSPGTWILAPNQNPDNPTSDTESCACVEGLGASPGTMTMDGLEICAPHRPHSAFLLSESAAFNVLSFDTCLFKGAPPIPGGSPPPAAAANCEAIPAPGDLNTPVTTASELPSFFGPSSLVEPPHISGKL